MHENAPLEHTLIRSPSSQRNSIKCFSVSRSISSHSSTRTTNRWFGLDDLGQAHVVRAKGTIDNFLAVRRPARETSIRHIGGKLLDSGAISVDEYNLCATRTPSLQEPTIAERNTLAIGRPAWSECGPLDRLKDDLSIAPIRVHRDDRGVDVFARDQYVPSLEKLGKTSV